MMHSMQKSVISVVTGIVVSLALGIRGIQPQPGRGRDAGPACGGGRRGWRSGLDGRDVPGVGQDSPGQ